MQTAFELNMATTLVRSGASPSPSASTEQQRQQQTNQTDAQGAGGALYVSSMGSTLEVVNCSFSRGCTGAGRVTTCMGRAVHDSGMADDHLK